METRPPRPGWACVDALTGRSGWLVSGALPSGTPTGPGSLEGCLASGRSDSGLSGGGTWREGADPIGLAATCAREACGSPCKPGTGRNGLGTDGWESVSRPPSCHPGLMVPSSGRLCGRSPYASRRLWVLSAHLTPCWFPCDRHAPQAPGSVLGEGGMLPGGEQAPASLPPRLQSGPWASTILMGPLRRERWEGGGFGLSRSPVELPQQDLGRERGASGLWGQWSPFQAGK